MDRTGSEVNQLDNTKICQVVPIGTVHFNEIFGQQALNYICSNIIIRYKKG